MNLEIRFCQPFSYLAPYMDHTVQLKQHIFLSTEVSDVSTPVSYFISWDGMDLEGDSMARIGDEYDTLSYWTEASMHFEDQIYQSYYLPICLWCSTQYVIGWPSFSRLTLKSTRGGIHPYRNELFFQLWCRLSKQLVLLNNVESSPTLGRTAFVYVLLSIFTSSIQFSHQPIKQMFSAFLVCMPLLVVSLEVSKQIWLEVPYLHFQSLAHQLAVCYHRQGLR